MKESGAMSGIDDERDHRSGMSDDKVLAGWADLLGEEPIRPSPESGARRAGEEEAAGGPGEVEVEMACRGRRIPRPLEVDAPLALWAVSGLSLVAMFSGVIVFRHLSAELTLRHLTGIMHFIM